MTRYPVVAIVGGIALVASACAGAATPAPTTAPAPQSQAPASSTPSEAASAPAAPAAPASIGPGEGQLNIIIWAGYAEDGTNIAAYDWVHPFQTQTGCTVNAKKADTSDQMVTLMRQGGGSVYDGVSASGDAPATHRRR
ncbi:MAG TPA: hypothetical protein VIM30_07940 [Candidatus Limnocylindrales bacterium]